MLNQLRRAGIGGANSVTTGVAPAEIAAAVSDNIGKSLKRAINSAREGYAIDKVLLIGGVAANACLRKHLARGQVFFASPNYSSDNAVGLAALARNAEIRSTNIDKL